LATVAVRTRNELRRSQSLVIGQEFFARFDILIQEVANSPFTKVCSIALGGDSIVRGPKQDLNDDGNKSLSGCGLSADSIYLEGFRHPNLGSPWCPPLPYLRSECCLHHKELRSSRKVKFLPVTLLLSMQDLIHSRSERAHLSRSAK
jgi:hypothetical protein